MTDDEDWIDRFRRGDYLAPCQAVATNQEIQRLVDWCALEGRLIEYATTGNSFFRLLMLHVHGQWHDDTDTSPAN